MAAAPAPAPLPNVAAINAAINGMAIEGNNMTQSLQNFNNHQQQMNNELALCTNFNTVHIQHQLNAINQSITRLTDMTSAQNWNIKAIIQNSKVHHATGALVAMRSVEPGPAPRVPMNQVIPNFPGTPDDVSMMSAAQYRDLLTSLDCPIPAGGPAATRQLRTAVREAIGLSAL